VAVVILVQNWNVTGEMGRVSGMVHKELSNLVAAQDTREEGEGILVNCRQIEQKLPQSRVIDL
jgi:hypothetical protein